MKLFRLSLAILIGAFLCRSSSAAPDPNVPEDTLSPDRRYGVVVPSGDDYPETNGNAVVETAAGKSVCEIEATTSAVHQNHGGYSASWTEDSRHLLWVADGKWFPRAIVLVEISDSGATKQVNVLKLCQEEILKRAKGSSPERYAATKKMKDEGGMGSAYPDGFTVAFEFPAESILTFPLTIALTLTNDPKGLAEENPAFAARLLNASMKGSIARDLTIQFTDFQLIE